MAIDIFLVIPRDPANPPITVAAEADPSVAAMFPDATVIPVADFELEVDNPAEVGSAGAGAGKVELSELTVNKFVDKASPSLFSACTSGRHFTSAQLYIRQSAGLSASTFLAYEFQTVFITRIDWSGSTGDELPAETLTMEYAALVIAYKPTGSASSPAEVAQSGWNRITNTSDVPLALALK